MAELQPESGPAYQDFLQWKSRKGIRKTGCRGPNNAIGSDYIPRTVLQEYLTTDRTKTLLKELFDKPNEVPPNADRVQTRYLRPFAILLAIGCGRMIRHFLDRQGLQDEYLPFSSEPENFPKSPTRNLFQAFHKEQWQFCAMQLEYDMSYDLADDYILPITAIEKIGEGGSAILYKITVDEAYNRLRPADSSYTATEKMTNTFALKTYRTPEAKRYFENERNGFVQLRYGERPPANIIGYYGSFVRNRTYNIILEYADRGTLEDYMETTPEPKNITTITTFWERFLASMGGLVQIHGTQWSASDGPNILLGWHHDIHPSNILVVSKSQDSPYDCDFKIADLGLAHFERYISSSNNAADNDRYGISTYGAPETYRNRDLERCHLLVLQSADIWSMGCVLSEVATWITEGNAKLSEYRRRRRGEIARRSRVSSTGEDRFHHVSEVLDTVKGIHAEIKDNTRGNDFITPCVIEKMVNGMVRSKPQDRGTAQYFLATSWEILDDAKRKLKEAMPSSPAPNRDHTISGAAVDVRKRRNPPNLPPDQIIDPALQRVETWHSNRSPVRAATLQSPPVHHAQGSSHAWQQNHAPEPNGEVPSRQNQGGHEEAHSDYHPRAPQRVSAQPTLSHRQSQHDPQSYYPGHTSGKYPPWEDTAMPAADGLSSKLKEPASIRDVTDHNEWDRPAENQSTAPYPLPVAPNDVSESLLTASPKSTRHYPKMSVTEGLRIKKEKQWKRAMYPGEDVIHEMDDILKNRDHVFLVDNGETMQSQRTKLEAVLVLLSTLTQPYDPDGLDLYFTTEPGKLKPKTPEKFLKYLRERPAHGLPDFRQRFARIIEEYQSRFGKTNRLSRWMHPNSMPSKGPRPLSLYVLTDGEWDPQCTLITEIKNLVTLLQRHELPNKHVGIQFIRFGNNPLGKQRLKTLDSKLGLDLDIIDTTSADGNVWKMLLGAVNDWYDYDVDSDDDAEDAVQPPHFSF